MPGGDKPEPADYKKVLQQISNRPDKHLLQTMLIRSLMQAVYQPENLGHFGLGYPAYAHFTSPIRRYPDLLIHRAIRFLIRNKSSRHLQKQADAGALSKKQIYPYSASEMQALGEHCSMAERRADAAGYNVMDWLKCEYMQDKIGDEFSGTVSSVTSFGLFVELNDIYIEGLVHITELRNDYYHFDPVRHCLEGERSRTSYHLGDSDFLVKAGDQHGYFSHRTRGFACSHNGFVRWRRIFQIKDAGLFVCVAVFVQIKNPNLVQFQKTTASRLVCFSTPNPQPRVKCTDLSNK